MLHHSMKSTRPTTMRLRLAPKQVRESPMERRTYSITESAKREVWILGNGRPSGATHEEYVVAALSHEALHLTLLRLFSSRDSEGHERMDSDEGFGAHLLLDWTSSLHWPPGPDGISWKKYG